MKRIAPTVEILEEDFHTKVESQCRLCGIDLEITKAVEKMFGHTTVCPTCIDNQSKEVEIQAQKAMWELICPEDFRDTSRDHHGFNRSAWEIVRYKDRENMFFLGDTGTCKTRIMIAFLKKQVLQGKSVNICWPEEFKEACTKKSKWQFLMNKSSYDYLGLDDVFTAGAASESVADLIKDLLDKRLREKKTTLITSQLTSSEISEDAKKWRNHTEAETLRIQAIIRRIATKYTIINFGDNYNTHNF